MTVKEYRKKEFESSCNRTPEYIEFEKQCKKELKKQIKSINANLLKFYPNHFQWYAVLEKDGKYVYVSIPNVRAWDWYNDVLIRTMKHDTDWTGGQNHKCSFDQIGAFANKLFVSGYQEWRS